ncbi:MULTISPECIES: cyclic nucleotide-binding domain-containing protein, partial [unclassified Sulfitobacter]|uniref:cyclic nucleotide-binding domain-containing protein n=1 Tax=unclassified Sulfitobacter TaxID=196795 RepID=UPI00374647AB
MTAHAISIHEDFPLTCQTCPARHDGICAEIDDDELLRIGRIKRYQKWGAGETIAIEGGSLPFVGSVVKGSACLTRSLSDGRVQMVGMLLPSDFVGKPGGVCVILCPDAFSYAMGKRSSNMMAS